MNRSPRSSVWLVRCAAVVSISTAFFLHACSTADPNFAPVGDGGSDAATEPDSPIDFGDASTADAGDCPRRCSSDMHDLLDCNGNVVTSCGESEGCNPESGLCIPACDSAKANKGSIGCDFYAVAPTAFGCFAVFVANTWSSPVAISVSYGGTQLNVANIGRIPSGSGAAITYAPLPGGQLPPGQVAILFVGGSGCPITSGFASGAVSSTSIGTAVHVTTSRPVSAYDIFPYGGGSTAVTSASLLIPTSSWDTNYVVVSPFELSTQTGSPGAVHLVAAENDTAITILPTKNIVGGTGVAAAAANVPKTYTIQKGQQLVIMQSQLLDGSPIQSTKPIAMWSSMGCFNVPADTMYCETAHQQIAPVKALGSAYALVRYRNRKTGGAEEAPPWRLLGLVDGTSLTWEPSTPIGAPTTLAAGEVVTFSGTGPYTVRSQDDAHPFYLSAHMTGCAAIGDINVPPDGCMGDAEFVNVVPIGQYQKRYVFFTDPTYPETDLVLVRAKASDGTFKDVKLDCAGTVGGWQPIGTGATQFTRVDLVRGNFAKQGNCDNGRHEVRSDGPFGITVWGWGSLATGTGNGDGFYTQAVSYAYPGGMSLQPINPIVILPTPK